MESEPAQIIAAESSGMIGPELDQFGSMVQVNLPTVLSMVGPQHPAVGFARWRVQQAYAQLDQAKVLWLPTLRAGFGFHRHDGNYQASDGSIVDVNRNSFQYGLGVGATGAGTTQRPGLIAEFHFADAIFQPRIAGRTATARSHGSQAVLNEQMMNAAVAYLDLLAAHQDLRIMEEMRERTAGLSKLTGDFASTGAGLQADADRMQTELALAENRLLAAREQVGVTEARLAQAISADANCQWLPMDATVLPLQVVDVPADRPATIQVGLANRPELREAQSLVAAACERYQREKYSPFVPSVLLGFSNGGFGGGLGNNLDNVDGRYDFDALVAWEIRNSGFGEHAARRETSSQVQMAKFEQIRMMDQVAREVSEAHTQVQFRSQQVTTAQRAIQNALDSYERNLSRIRDGQGLPLESLQSLRALEEAQRTYLRAVTDYNQAQFRLQWAMGWPITSPAEATANVIVEAQESI
jgi:outer membrane protein TolC